jgi:hypothetical protein
MKNRQPELNVNRPDRTNRKRQMKKYMVIETFLPDCKSKIYERFYSRGRMLPAGLVYLDSWLEKDGDRCFQLMETDDPKLFNVWTDKWSDLVSFEIIELGDKPKQTEKRAIE